MSELVEIDYTTLMYMVVGIFGLVGFLRGWWKEAITTGLLTILLLLLKKPDWAGTIVGFIDSIVSGIWNAIMPIFQSSDVMGTAVQALAPPEVDPQQSSVYVTILILLVIASYFFGKVGLTTKLSAGGRILGALLGFFNGFVAVSLVLEFVIGRFLPGAPDVSAAAAPPSSLSIQVTNLPEASIADSPTAFFFISAGFVIFVVAILTAWKVERLKVQRKEPPFYQSKKIKEPEMKIKIGQV